MYRRMPLRLRHICIYMYIAYKYKNSPHAPCNVGKIDLFAGTIVHPVVSSSIRLAVCCTEPPQLFSYGPMGHGSVSFRDGCIIVVMLLLIMLIIQSAIMMIIKCNGFEIQVYWLRMGRILMFVKCSNVSVYKYISIYSMAMHISSA